MRGDLERGFVRAELLTNLDDPLGFAFGQDEGVYGVYLGGGVEL